MADQWELKDGANHVGPYSETQIVALIVGGLNVAGVVARREGHGEWAMLGMHEPFAEAIAARVKTSAAEPIPLVSSHLVPAHSAPKQVVRNGRMTKSEQQKIAVALLALFIVLVGCVAMVVRSWRRAESAAASEPASTGIPESMLASDDPRRVGGEVRRAPQKPIETWDQKVAKFAKLSPQERLALVSDPARACRVGSARADQAAEFEAVEASGHDPKERAALRALWTTTQGVCAAKRASSALASADDGPALSAAQVLAAAREIDGAGVKELRTLPKTSYREAMKDPAAVRGHVIGVEGTIIQIRKDDAGFSGTFSSESGYVYFYVVGGTKGLVDGSSAAIVGLFVQRYFYPNQLGGTTESALIVGRFMGQADTELPLPARPASVAAPIPAVKAAAVATANANELPDIK